jgi:hypothetical protein
LRANLIDQLERLIGDVVRLELAGKSVTLAKLFVVGDPTRDCCQIRHAGFAADRAKALILDQSAADRLCELFAVFGRPLG